MLERIKKIGEYKYLLPIMVSLLFVVGIVSKVFPINLDFFFFCLLLLWLGINLIITFENAFCVILFLMTCPLIEFTGCVIVFYDLMYAITTIVFGCKYIIRVWKKDAQLHIFPLVMSIVLVLYSLIYIKDITITAFFGNTIFIALIYIFYCYSKEVSRKKLAMLYMCGLLINILSSTFLMHFARFKNSIVLDGRFAGLFDNPNALQFFCVIALSIVVMFYFKKYIDILIGGTMAIVFVIAGLTTLSKAFLICLAVLVVISCILLIRQNKRQGLIFVGGGIVILLLFSLVFWNRILMILERFAISYSYDNILDTILTGRYSLWKAYIGKWSSSIVSIVFGCGVFAPYAAWNAAHSLYVDLLYRYGIVGCLLVISLVVSYFVISKDKRSRFSCMNILPLLMFLLIGIEESLLVRRVLFVFVMSFVVYDERGNFAKEKGEGIVLSKLKFIKFKDLLSIIPMVLTFIPAMITKIFIRDFWLICEERCEARDNGYWLFKYIRENQPQQKVAYAINKKCKEYSKVKDLGKVINYGGFAHWFWYFVADRNISSQKGGKPNNALCYLLEVVFKLRKNNRVFLQHGVTINDVEFLYYKNTNMRLFTTATFAEYDYISKKFGYPDGHVQLLGLPRFDNLSNKNLKKNQILVMPTWRNWITKEVECEKYEGSSQFTETGYYKAWSEFLNSEVLDKWLRKNKKQIIFYPHRNMQMYLEHFKTASKNITIASSGDYDVQTLLNESSILITDYSSVFFDFAYLEKPIIFYQFDEEKFRAGQYGAGYFDYHNNDLSVWTDNMDGVVKSLDDILEGKEEKTFDSKKVFKYIDTSNCKRNYLAIQALGKQKFRKEKLSVNIDGKE